MSILFSLAKALGLTLVLELLFALAWGLRKEKLLTVVLMNLLTNPAANLIYYGMRVYLGWHTLLPVLMLELFVIGAEGLCCQDFMEKPWAFVILANVFSYAAGLLLQTIC